MKKMIALIAALGAMAVAPSGAAGWSYPGAVPTKIDRAWVQEALRIDLFEIKGGEQAMRQASNPKVAGLGALLAREHAVAFAEDREVAREIDAPVPTAPSPAMKSGLQRLGEASGAAFDRAYLEIEAEGHLGAIRKAGAEIVHGSDATAVDAAAMNLRMYERHLEAARDVTQKG